MKQLCPPLGIAQNAQTKKFISKWDTKISKALQLFWLWYLLMFLNIKTLCPLALNMDIEINAENSNLTEHMEISPQDTEVHKSGWQWELLLF